MRNDNPNPQAVPFTHTTCERCQGTGIIRRQAYGPAFQKCPDCDGWGSMPPPAQRDDQVQFIDRSIKLMNYAAFDGDQTGVESYQSVLSGTVRHWRAMGQ